MNLFFRFLKKIFFTAFIFILGTLALLFIIIFILGLVGCTDNVSQKPYAKDIYLKQFELEKDSFLFKMKGNQEYDIEVPGMYSGVPVSVEDFINHPEDWDATDNYMKRYGHQNPHKEEIIGVLKKGTRVQVVKVAEEWNIINSYLWIYVRIEDGPFANIISKISLIRIRRNGNEIPYYRDIKRID